MMSIRTSVAPYAWVFTDAYGRIEMASPGARELLGNVALDRGADWLRLLPLPRRALVRDIQLALTGWPTERDVILKRFGRRSVALRYRVSQRLQDKGVGLYWQLQTSDANAFKGWA
jgi:hypothetical protein